MLFCSQWLATERSCSCPVQPARGSAGGCSSSTLGEFLDPNLLWHRLRRPFVDAKTGQVTATRLSQSAGVASCICQAVVVMSAMSLALAGKARIGWVGAGVMGRHMCGHLVAKGLKATVFSRTIAKAEPLRLLGATLADSVAEVFMRMSQIAAPSGRSFHSQPPGCPQQRCRVYHARTPL
jgi:hypothetical protein